MWQLIRDKHFCFFYLSSLCLHFGTGIAMIGIPWAILQKEKGEQLLGMLTITVAILVLILTPVWGMLTDRFSRKRLLLWTDGIGCVLALGLLLFTIMKQPSPSSLDLCLFYLVSIMLYSLRIPILFAFTQEVVAPPFFSAANSLLEIQYQVSYVAAGATVAVLVNHVALIHIFTITVSTCFISLALLLLTYRFTTIHTVHTPEGRWRKNPLHDVVEGWRYLRQRPSLLMFFTCAQFPYVGVMVGTYLFPLFVTQTLQADGSVYALGEMFYSIGALAACLVLRSWMNSVGEQHTVQLSIGMVAIGTTVIACLHSSTLFFLTFLLIGFGNAGARISSRTLMMHIVPPELNGRINSFFMVLATFLRVFLTSVFTLNIDNIQPSYSILIVGTLMFAAFIGVKLSKRIENRIGDKT